MEVRVCMSGPATTVCLMNTAGAQFSNQAIYDTAKNLSAVESLPFAEAHLLCRFVLEFGGRPVSIRGRQAPKFDKKILRRLVKAGLLERGGHEGARNTRVASIMNTSTNAWNPQVELSPGALVVSAMSASDEAIALVVRHVPAVPGSQSVNAEPLRPIEQRAKENALLSPSGSGLELGEGGASQDSLPSVLTDADNVGSDLNGRGPESLLLRPENEEAYWAGGQPVTATLSAFSDSGFPNFELSHVLDQLVRDLCELDGQTLLERPAPGTVAIMAEIHGCGVAYCRCAARFDMLVENDNGPFWANVCAYHAKRKGLTTLGMGRAQYLLHPDELDTPSVRAATEALAIPLERIFDLSSADEPQWSRSYRRFGFVRTADGRLVRRGLKATVWAELLDPVRGAIGIKVREAGSFPFDDGGWDAVHPASWSDELIRELLFDVFKDEFDLPRSQPLTMSVTEAESIVRAGLRSCEGRLSLHDHLEGDDVGWFGAAISTLRPSPYGRALAVVSEGSFDYDLLRRVCEQYPGWNHHLSILRRDDCPEDILLAAVETPSGRRALLDKKAGLPPRVTDRLFTRIALSSTAQESRETMFRAAVHPAVPLPLLEGILEKALTERGSRTALIAESAELDGERRGVIRTAVLRKTHRGKVQDDVMSVLLGPEGVRNRGVVNWVATLTDGGARERALRWIAEREESAGGHLEDDVASVVKSN